MDKNVQCKHGDGNSKFLNNIMNARNHNITNFLLLDCKKCDDPYKIIVEFYEDTYAKDTIWYAKSG